MHAYKDITMFKENKAFHCYKCLINMMIIAVITPTVCCYDSLSRSKPFSAAEESSDGSNHSAAPTVKGTLMSCVCGSNQREIIVNVKFDLQKTSFVKYWLFCGVFFTLAV